MQMGSKVTIVGLTGSIGSGKSTVSQMFVALGAHLIDYDMLAREVVQPYEAAWRDIVDTFGEAILNKDLTLNREKLAGIVFVDPEKLQVLNSITHPAVFNEAEKRVQEITRSDPNGMIIKDVPLLIEAGIHRTVDKVVVVGASRENRIGRLIARGLSQEEALRRIDSQMPLKEKVAYADFVIHNDGPLSETQKQVQAVYQSLN